MSDWVPPLADMILDDRVDRGVTPTRALERAEHYRRWLDSLSSPHDRLDLSGGGEDPSLAREPLLP